MARPLKQDAERRHTNIRVRDPRDGKERIVATRPMASARCDLTLEEKRQLKDAARTSGMSEAAYLRHLITNAGKPPAPHSRSADKPSPNDAALINELNRIGVNLNQLTRDHHTGRRAKVDLPALATDLRAALSKVLDRYGA